MEYAAGKASLWRDPELQLALDWFEKEKPTPTWAERYQPGFKKAITFLKKSKMRARTIDVGKIAIGLTLVALAGAAVNFGIKANQEKEKALLREKAASVTNLLPAKPVTALLLAIQATVEKEEKLKYDDLWDWIIPANRFGIENKEKLKKEDLPEVESSLLSALQGAKWSTLFNSAEGLGSTEDVISPWLLSSRDQKTIVSTHFF